MNLDRFDVGSGPYDFPDAIWYDGGMVLDSYEKGGGKSHWLRRRHDTNGGATAWLGLDRAVNDSCCGCVGTGRIGLRAPSLDRAGVRAERC
jgi:hypothetical protein